MSNLVSNVYCNYCGGFIRTMLTETGKDIYESHNNWIACIKELTERINELERNVFPLGK